MKKTLAAVLAAMMALSTSAVALAKDTDVSGDVSDLPTLAAGDPSNVEGILYGKKAEFVLSTSKLNDDLLGKLLKEELIKIDVTVTNGRSLLKKAPSVSVVKAKTGALLAKLTMDVKDTFNTDADDTSSDKDITLRVRVTALENLTDKGYGDIGMAKGDTLSVDEIPFNVFYRELTNYGKDMTITADEVSNKWVVAEFKDDDDDSEGYDLLTALEDKGTETATFYFDETAAFTAKISEAQKNVNLAYSTKIADEYYEEYPEVEFEAIKFEAAPKFLRKGTLTFNAIGEEDTVVYEVTSEGLVELEIAEYDSTYETVTVEGINTLTSYLVASEALEVEVEAEVEEPAVEEENPNTGAC